MERKRLLPIPLRSNLFHSICSLCLFGPGALPPPNRRKGVGLIPAKSIRVNDDDRTENGDQTAFIDSTVQEKNITCPTDAKLHKKIIKHCHRIAVGERLPVRQSYGRTLKELAREQRFRNHPKTTSWPQKLTKESRPLPTGWFASWSGICPM